MKVSLFLIFFLPLISPAQNILPDANTIVAKGFTFLTVCNTLIDSGYRISKKDMELQTVSTEPRKYPNRWNATYIMSIRVKDSCIYISGTFSAPPGGGLFKDEVIKNWTNKKGETKAGSIGGYAFIVLNEFAKSLGREITYLKM